MCCAAQLVQDQNGGSGGVGGGKGVVGARPELLTEIESLNFVSRMHIMCMSDFQELSAVDSLQEQGIMFFLEA